MRSLRSIAALSLCWVLLAPSAPASSAEPKDTAASRPTHEEQARRGSGLPVPRFASMRSDEVNVRAGPGTRYPVE